MPTSWDVLAEQSQLPPAPPEDATEEELAQLALLQQAQAAPEVPLTVQEKFLKAAREANDQQKRGVDLYQKNVDQLLGRQGQQELDLTPLAAFSDSMFGTKLTQAAMANRPMTEAQRMQMAAKFQDELQRRRGELSKSEIDLYKTQIALGQGKEKADAKLKEPSAGEKAADVAFAKDASAYFYSGGKAKVDKNLTRFEQAIAALEANPGLTGGVLNKLPGGANADVQDILNPKLAEVRDTIRSAVQESLREILGPQFTEKEGEAIFNRAFNPRLSVEENVRRAKAELSGLRNMKNAKEASFEYFSKNGTLKGFKPKMSGPAVGTTKSFKGVTYTFTGGDPSDKNNWAAK